MAGFFKYITYSQYRGFFNVFFSRLYDTINVYQIILSKNQYSLKQVDTEKNKRSKLSMQFLVESVCIF